MISIGILAATGGASAMDLFPHRAVYDLVQSGQSSSEFDSIDGRIVVEVKHDSCDAYELEYRFVARFVGNQELIVVDQQIELDETLDGKTLEFSNVSTVDGLRDQASIGKATTGGGKTEVRYDQPADKIVEIAAASFPISHTRNLIEAAKRGEFVYEAQIFDGDPEAEKQTRSTSIIADTPDEPDMSGEAAAEGDGSEEKPGSDVLAGLTRWRISEAYYDATGGADAEPDFSTSYTLYENGVSDALTMNFEGYSLSGQISEFTPLQAVDCSGTSVEN
ncbi:hypothetical protein FP2506_08071 [Fulvimarina pelagi HTCC2506]|uniref:DUF1849 family protein n=1 Tax=Fulvimarina pelagi HTCC2506 TaxID=314231 RepID=Q0G6D2_9HYPH|nr:hypothetical protein FP2506_08071 [Fulvimarina pelagi HTCC2506]